ncbi:hypothetical protein DFJ73DRAFT_962262 [Zopfochytrium polystomum]|nr:hypothetical protein DFJ73DRAFT_962262 [Zopfochytrium polystomum]
MSSLNAKVAVPAAPAEVAADPSDLVFVAGVHSNSVVAVSKSSRGARAWVATTGAIPETRSNSLIAHPPTGCVVAVLGRRTLALHARSGRVRWVTPELRGSGLLSTGCRPVVALDCGALAVRPDGTDACRWFLDDYDTAAAEPSQPAMLRDMLFLGHYSVYGKRVSDGAHLWTFEHSGVGAHPMLLIEDGVLYVGGVGELFALDALSGTLLWSVKVPEFRAVEMILSTMRTSPLYLPRNYDPSSTNRPSVPTASSSSSTTASDDTKKEKKQAPPALPHVSPLFVSVREKIVQLDPSTGRVVPDRPTISFKDLVKGSCSPTGIIPLPSKGRLLVWNREIVYLANEQTGKCDKYRINFKWYLPSLLVGSGAPPLPATTPTTAPPPPGSGDPELPPYTQTPLPFPPPPPPSPSQPRAGYRLFVYLGNTLYCLHAETGAVVWRHVFRALEDPGYAFLLADAATDRVFVAGGHHVHCVDATGGARVWSYSAPWCPLIHIASRELGNGEANRSPVALVPIIQENYSV